MDDAKSTEPHAIPQGPVTFQLDSRKFEYVDLQPMNHGGSPSPSGGAARVRRPENKPVRAVAAADGKRFQESPLVDNKVEAG